MSCICQFHTPDEETPVPAPLDTTDDAPLPTSSTNDAAKEPQESNAFKTAVSASALADCRSENWLLKKKLREYEVTIENLEQLVTTIVEKQHQILSEMFYLRKENQELQTECHLQREYHSMERNALMRELHDAQTLCRSRSFLLESKSGSSSKPRAPPFNCESPHGADAYTSESDQCDNGCGSSEDQESDREENFEELSVSSLTESSENSAHEGSTSGDQESDDNRSRDDESNDDDTISNSDSD
ncbi:uncharacterized protein LOC108095136 [Drosophila ficusphila]|uniref:uncharacterized protein LOC108095136 n=1 Tax=Drosophila ficusphila TaxID=30025 RepID=UPI0007E6E463|nr:uncharacterized protein LOC108095136 [Drosophila ficusphila]